MACLLKSKSLNSLDDGMPHREGIGIVVEQPVYVQPLLLQQLYPPRLRLVKTNVGIRTS
jgi:hypothetical protein